ncbi:organomercurial lyase [Streptomyces sp. NPDC005506]|uniref:organomercurial lyase n=1 Tax=unclassified Streptomyces TaxID=2593676 RepID=UPI0036D1B01B
MPEANLSFTAFLPAGIGAVDRGGIAHSQAQLNPALRALHQTLLRTFLATGRGPSAATAHDLARHSRLDPGAALQALADADLVHLDTAGERIEIAYPLSGTPSPHQVRLHNGPPLSAMCAIDALGIPLMTSAAATIDSRDPDTGRPVRITRDTGGTWTWEPATTVVVLAAVKCTGPIAGACRHTAFHADADLAAAHLAKDARRLGQVLTQHQALAVAQTEFGPLLEGGSRY